VLSVRVELAEQVVQAEQVEQVVVEIQLVLLKLERGVQVEQAEQVGTADRAEPELQE
jgi:hypothetical protein